MVPQIESDPCGAAAWQRSKMKPVAKCCKIYGDDYADNDCDEGFTPSGCQPPKTVGPLNRSHDLFAKYAPCGHWSSCKKNGCGVKKYFDACNSCPSKGRNFLSIFDCPLTV